MAADMRLRYRDDKHLSSSAKERNNVTAQRIKVEVMPCWPTSEVVGFYNKSGPTLRFYCAKILPWPVGPRLVSPVGGGSRAVVTNDMDKPPLSINMHAHWVHGTRNMPLNADREPFQWRVESPESRLGSAVGLPVRSHGSFGTLISRAVLSHQPPCFSGERRGEQTMGNTAAPQRWYIAYRICSFSPSPARSLSIQGARPPVPYVVQDPKYSGRLFLKVINHSLYP